MGDGGESLEDWFVHEVLVHDVALTRYLMRAWPNAAEVPDLRQAAYVRVYEAAGNARPFAPKTFLFATARHLMIDRIRHGRIVSIDAVGHVAALDLLVDEISPEDHLGAHQQLRLLARAFDRLPERCREVIWLRRVEELSHNEIARRLGISEKAVEKYIARGTKLLSEHLCGEDGSQSSRTALGAQSRQEGKQSRSYVVSTSPINTVDDRTGRDSLGMQQYDAIGTTTTGQLPSLNGSIAGDSDETAVRGVAGSHFGKGMTSEFANVLVLADSTKLKAYPLGVVADYIAVIALTRTRWVQSALERH
jgi:RNA polymerase sigma factor (sigma-70 family)